MRQKLKYFLLIILSLFVFYMVYSILDKSKKLNDQKEKIKVIPEFSILTLSDNRFYISDLDADEYTLLIYFSTHCIYCQYQIEDLTKNYSLLNNTKILLISKENIDTVKKFAQNYNLINYEPNIITGVMPLHEFNTKFGKFPSPSIFLYDTQKKLILFNKGVLSIDTIKTFYNSNNKFQKTNFK